MSELLLNKCFNEGGKYAGLVQKFINQGMLFFNEIDYERAISLMNGLLSDDTKVFRNSLSDYANNFDTSGQNRQIVIVYSVCQSKLADEKDYEELKKVMLQWVYTMHSAYQSKRFDPRNEYSAKLCSQLWCKLCSDNDVDRIIAGYIKDCRKFEEAIMWGQLHRTIQQTVTCHVFQFLYLVALVEENRVLAEAIAETQEVYSEDFLSKETAGSVLSELKRFPLI